MGNLNFDVDFLSPLTEFSLTIFYGFDPFLKDEFTAALIELIGGV